MLGISVSTLPVLQNLQSLGCLQVQIYSTCLNPGGVAPHQLASEYTNGLAVDCIVPLALPFMILRLTRPLVSSTKIVTPA